MNTHIRPGIAIPWDVPLSILRKIGVGCRFRYWPLSKKILAGYGLVFAVAITGIATSFAIAKHAEERALIIQVKTIEDMAAVGNLKVSLLELTHHHQSILERLEYAEELGILELRAELTHFIEGYEEFRHHWFALTQLDEFGVIETDIERSMLTTSSAAEIAASILQDHKNDVHYCIDELDALFQQIAPSSLNFEQLPLLRSTLVELEQSDFIGEFDSFLDKLVNLAAAAEEEQHEAEVVLKQASAALLNITLASVILFGIVGLLLMAALNRILLRPLHDMTQTAQQSIQNANFDLKVPVTSHDEVGTLAETFNAYMQFVKELLSQYKHSNQQLQTTSEITNQKLLATLDELHHTQAQVVQSEKMSSLGHLVAGVAHEINNPVTFISGNLAYVRQVYQDLVDVVQLYHNHDSQPTDEIRQRMKTLDMEFLKEDMPELFHSVQIGIERIQEIMSALQTFSRLDESDSKETNMHQDIESVLLILQNRLKEKADRSAIQVIKDYGEIPLIQCYPGQLNQVFMNILVNAVDALEEKMEHQSFQEQVEHPSRITVKTSLIDNQWAKIAIADNGPGIAQDVQHRIFDPFFTTKPIGKGQGLGMAISYQVVTERHGGRLDCFSVPGKGTEFVIQIPL